MNLTFTRYTLANGLTLLVKENHYAPSVVVRGRLWGGANLDPVAKPGVASLATGLMRRGTQTRTYTQINQIVESLGASVYVSGGRHLTAFGGKSLAEDFAQLLELMVDNLTQPTFPADQIEKVRGQMITSLHTLEDSPRGLAHRNFRQILYGPQHPYGRPYNGTVASVAAINRADLVEFYQKLHPQSGVVVVVGDVDSQAAYDRLEATLGQWLPDSAPQKPAFEAPPLLTEPVRHIHSMPDKSQTELVIGYLGPPRLAKDFYAAEVADTILGQLGLGGRIGQNIRDKEGMAYHAQSSLTGGFGPGPWYVYAGVNAHNVDRTLDLMLTEIAHFQQTPVTEPELADAQAYLTGILPLQMEANEGIAAMLLEMHLFELGDEFIAHYPQLINGVTRDQVQTVVQKYMDPQVYALSIAGPYREPAQE